MANLLIVASTPSENTRRLRDAVLRGATHPDIGGIDVRVKTPAEAGSEDILWADGLILGTTENFGYMAGALKDWFERIYYPCLDKTAGLPYALFVRAGNDGQGAKTSVERIVTGLRWNAVQTALVLKGEYKSGFEQECEVLGMTLAAGLEAGIY